jgi:polysaccharide biosynthesis transport protein
MNMDDDADLREYWGVIRKRKLIFTLGFLLVLVVVIAYTFLSEPVYEAKSMVVITNQNQANFLLGNSAPGTSNIETQRIIIQSPSVMRPIMMKYSDTDFDMVVNHIRNSNILEIVIRTNNPEVATNIANDVAQSYITYATETVKEDAESNVEFISEKIRTYEAEINVLDLQLRSYNLNQLSRAELMEYRSLEKELDAKTTIYNHLLTKREEAILTTQLSNTNLRIIQYAEVPERPVRPNRELNLILGFVLALGVGAGLSIIANNASASRRNRI